MKPDKIIRVKCSPESFYRAFLEILTPYHKLASREKDVAARVIAQRAKLMKSVSDPEVLKEVLWSQTSRNDMRESLGISREHFQLLLGKLRRCGILVDGGVDPRYVPKMTDEPRFFLGVLFDWSSPDNPATPSEASDET